MYRESRGDGGRRPEAPASSAEPRGERVSFVEEKMQQGSMTMGRAKMVEIKPKKPAAAAPPLAVDRWVTEQMFEEDLRAILRMVRPHGRERLMGWKEYRTGGANFRVTVSWDEALFEAPEPQPLYVPKMADVIEALLIGSARHQDELTPEQEFGHYRAVVAELNKRIDEMERCYT